ncbi:hypothetical protein OOK31_02320 [Streptomyces sp. NBC_00249]|uniref:hypothetical protein n=1 Tax=Streptomyces sp. NBC_00249 TaxID=2975690 RepID=UPI00224E29FE|nr:hypothetical protein [Streptomyces sp. NBC_00249]MCX5192735.1 hypothetical protein [Streptomyces sp. NBC_00249]
MEFVRELARLAATGRFGAFHAGVHLSEVVAAYGEPEWSGRVDREERWPHWFGYGGLQPVFCRCRRLDALYVPARHEELTLPGPGRGESRSASLPVTGTQLTAALEEAGATFRTRWSEDAPDELPDQWTLYAEPAPHTVVTFTFWNRDPEEGTPKEDWPLYQAGLSGSDHTECPEPDRSLPDDGYGA